MTALAPRSWVPAECEALVQRVAGETASRATGAVDAEIARLIALNTRIHDRDCINLNPATNVMNPRAEAALAAGLGSRPSLGYPGDKYEMGLEAIERIEVIAAELAAETFAAAHAEIRVASGAMANLYAFMATCKPGDAIVTPPPAIAGHVTHHTAGCAGLYGLAVHHAPIDADGFTVDLDGLRDLVRRVRPKLVTLGGSLNLAEHPVAAVRAIADEGGAKLLFDAAHVCGLIAGKVWANPPRQGAHLMTMSTYKSLGGPAGGLVLTNDAGLAEAIDRIAFPGLTANFDASKAAALAIGLLDWREHGAAYARTMVETAGALAEALAAEGLPVHRTRMGFTTSHQLAVEAHRWGGGQAASKRLRQADVLACGIGLPVGEVAGDVNGLRLGTPEIVRRGMRPEHMPELARLIARALAANDPAGVAREVNAFRARFTGLHFVRETN